MAESAGLVLNGFFGQRKGRIDVGDLARAEAQRLDLKAPIRIGRGGAGPVSYKRHFRWLKKHAGADRLLLIGKSYGGHWARKMLFTLADKDVLLRFGEVRLLTVDPSFVLHSLSHRKFSLPGASNIECLNLYQHGPRGGYQIDDACNEMLAYVEHQNIELNPRVQEAVREHVQWLHGVGPNG